MGNHFSKRKFINETLEHLRRNNVILRDEYDYVITKEEIIMTLEGMYKRQSIHYYTNLRCKPKMLELYVPNWWCF